MGCNCGKKKIFYTAPDSLAQDMVDFLTNSFGDKINPVRVVNEVRYIPKGAKVFLFYDETAPVIKSFLEGRGAVVTFVTESELS